MRLTVYIVITLGLMTMPSCRNASTLASQLEGPWQGDPEPISLPYGGVGVVSLTYNFVRESDENGGSVELTASFVDPQAFEPSEGAAGGRNSVDSSVGVATIQGTWRAIDSDEMEITLDPSTLNCSIDHKTVELIQKGTEGRARPASEAFKAGDAALLKQDLLQAISRLVIPQQQHFSQIQINDDMMRWRINGHYRVLISPRPSDPTPAG